MPKISDQQKETVKNDILQAAKTVFGRQGYEAATMKDIVAETGRSFGGVYMYFSSKEELFYELLKRQYGAMEVDIDANQAAGCWDALASFLDHQQKRAGLAESGLAPCLYEFFIVGRRDELRKQMIAERYNAVYDSIKALIDSGIRSGEFQPVQSSDTLIHFLISYLDGIFVESIITGDERIRIQDQFELLKRLLKSSLQPGAIDRPSAGRSSID
ncbi:TetR family transcriptional regulator [Paenibacillus sp. GCM10012303]|uniref:TetR family transcriptional regulator n=1 Tax=Paenibacillus sp. GCM10012303 TaxID=3317340 RepID=UPI00361D9763